MKEWYQYAGIDYEEGVRRFLGNEPMYQSFLIKFLQDDSFARLQRDLQAGNLAMADIDVHMLKGVAGNLSMMELFYAADNVIRALQQKSQVKDIQAVMGPVCDAYDKACDAIFAWKKAWELRHPPMECFDTEA